jgi:hypothetical protein
MSDATSIYVGVSARKSGWLAHLTLDYVRHATMVYPTERDAAIAYDRLVLFYRGRAAPRNFPEETLQPASFSELKWELAMLRKTDPRYRRVLRLPPLRLAGREGLDRRGQRADRPLGVYRAPAGRWIAWIHSAGPIALVCPGSIHAHGLDQCGDVPMITPPGLSIRHHSDHSSKNAR